MTNTAARQDQVKMLLAAAAKKPGMKVWLGLAQDETPFYGNAKYSAAWMAAQTQLAKDVAQQLWASYGATYAAQIAGFYLPFEADNFQFGVGTNTYTNYQSYARGVAGWIHTDIGAGYGVMASPYHVATTIPTTDQLVAYQNAVTGLIDGSGVTVWAPQDNVGAGSDPTLVAQWMYAARLGVDASHAPTSPAGVAAPQLWGNVEQYSQQGANTFPIGELVQHMKNVNANARISGTVSGTAGISTFIGFSLGNFATGNWLQGANAGLRVAYQQYLAAPTQLQQSVPAVGNLSAAVVAGTLDVSVQWSVQATNPTPGATVAIAPILGYQVWRDGQPIGQIPQPFSNTQDPTTGFFTPITSKPAAFTDPTVPTGHTFTYEVAAFDAYGNLSNRQQVSVTVPLGAADVLDTTTNRADTPAKRVSDNTPYRVVPHDQDPANVFNQVTAGSGGAFTDGAVVNKLVDGNPGDARFQDPAWAGIAPGTAPVIEVTLAQPADIHSVRSDWLTDASAGVAAPITSPDVQTAPQPASIDPVIIFTPMGRPYFGTAGADTNTGTNPGGTISIPQINNPGTGWYTSSLAGSTSHSVKTVRITPPVSTSWQFISEVQVQTITGVNVCARAGACTVRLMNPTNNTTVAPNPTYTTTQGGTLTSPQINRYSSGTLISSSVPWSTTNAVGWNQADPFDIVLDLGQNQPIGQISTDWFNDNVGGGVQTPTITATYLPDGPNAAPAPSAAWQPVPISSVTNGTITSYTATLTTRSGTTNNPTLARWVKLAISGTTAGWAITAGITISTPTTWDLAHCDAPTCNAPALYQSDQDTTKTDGTWPTTVKTAGAPALSTVGHVPVSSITCASADQVGCATDSPFGNRAITQIPPTPAPGQDPAGWDYIRANGLTLRPSQTPNQSGRTAWDVVVPIGWADPTQGSSWSQINATTLTFVYNRSLGVALPDSVDLFYTTPGDVKNGARDDHTRGWSWSGGTQTTPRMPTYLPSNTTYLYAFTFAPFTTYNGSTVEELRFHINTNQGTPQEIITRAQAAVWR